MFSKKNISLSAKPRGRRKLQFSGLDDTEIPDDYGQVENADLNDILHAVVPRMRKKKTDDKNKAEPIETKNTKEEESINITDETKNLGINTSSNKTRSDSQSRAVVDALNTDPIEYLATATQYHLIQSGDVLFAPPTNGSSLRDTTAIMHGEAMHEINQRNNTNFYQPVMTGDSIKKMMRTGVEAVRMKNDDFMEKYQLQAPPNDDDENADQPPQDEKTMDSDYFLNKFADFVEWKTGELSFIEKLGQDFEQRNSLISKMASPTKQLSRDMEDWRKVAMSFNDKTKDLYASLCEFGIASDDLDQCFQNKIRLFPKLERNLNETNKSLELRMDDIQKLQAHLQQCTTALKGTQSLWKSKYTPFKDNLQRIQKIRQNYIQQKKKFGQVNFVEHSLERHLRSTLDRQLDFQSSQIEYTKATTDITAMYYQLQQKLQFVMLQQKDTLLNFSLFLKEGKQFKKSMK